MPAGIDVIGPGVDRGRRGQGGGGYGEREYGVGADERDLFCRRW